MPGEEGQKDSTTVVSALLDSVGAMALARSVCSTVSMNVLPYVAGVVIGAALFGSFGKSLPSDAFVLLRHRSSIPELMGVHLAGACFGALAGGSRYF